MESDTYHRIQKRNGPYPQPENPVYILFLQEPFRNYSAYGYVF
jgi:hypothetical protein